MNSRNIIKLLLSTRSVQQTILSGSLYLKKSLIVNLNFPKVANLSWHVLKQRPRLFLWTLPFLSSTLVVEESKDPNLVSQKKEIKDAILEADELFESNRYKEAISTLLLHKETGNVEVLWRLSRAQYNLAQSSDVKEPEKRQLIEEAFSAVSEALAKDDSHWAVHKWMSVLLDAHATYQGIKARVAQLEHVKAHMMKAAELNPNDATTFYMLGSWCYQIADMPWIQRKIAATIFAAPPTSSFEEALQFFSQAEEIDPNFYSLNLLMLGKTLLKLCRPEEAFHYLSLAKEYPCSSEEDNQVRREAVEILKKIKIKEDPKAEQAS